MKAYLYLLLFVLLGFQVHAQFTMDWATTIYESYRAGSSIPFMFDPETVTDAQDNIYVTGLAAGSGFDLYLGSTDLLATGNQDDNFYLAQTSPDGHPNWLLRFSGRRGSYGFVTDAPTLFPRAEGGVIMVSLVNHEVILGLDTLAVLADRRHLLIAHISPLGEVISHSLTRLDIPTISTIRQARNGDIVVTGNFRNPSLRIGDKVVRSDISPAYFVARINNESGEVVWAQSPDPSPRSGVIGDPYLEELSDGNYLLIYSPGGYHGRRSGGLGSLPLIQASKLNASDGTILWQQEIAEASFGHILDFEETTNGDIYLVGSFSGELTANNGESYQSLRNDSHSLTTGCLLKMTADGQVFDVEVSPDGFTGNRIIQLPNQQYLLGGRVNWENSGLSSEYGLSTGFVLKLFSPTDELLYQQNISKDFMKASDLAFLDVQLVDEQHIICTGRYWGKLLETDVFTPEGLSEQVFIAQLKIPEINTPVDDQASGESLNIFPNPVRDYVNIDLGASLFGERPVQIFNTQGQLVFEQSNIGERNEFRIPTANLQQGTYILQVGENGPRTKLIKLGQR